MARDAVFLDTAGLIALRHARDALHEQARVIERELTARRTPLVTSDWVLAEFLGGASSVAARSAASALVRQLRASRRAMVIEASREGWDRAFDLYASRPDKEWSLVDCASMLACREGGIERVFTSDHHFEQAGFAILLK